MEFTVKLNKRKLLVLLPMLLLIGGGAALAAWLISSQGSGGAKIGTLAAPTVTAYAAGPDDLWPGNGAGSIGIHVVNTSTHDIKLVSVSTGSNSTATASNPTNCPATNFLWNGAGQSGGQFAANAVATLTAPLTIPSGTNDLTIPAASFPAGKGLSLDANSPSTCMGLGVTLAGFTFNFSS